MCYNSEEGILVYLHAAGVNGTTTDYTFTAEIVDTTTGVGVYPDISLIGSTPYISYIYAAMTETQKGPKYAYRDGTSLEYGIDPCSVNVKNTRTGIVSILRDPAPIGATWARGPVAAGMLLNTAIGFAGSDFGGTKFHLMFRRPRVIELKDEKGAVQKGQPLFFHFMPNFSLRRAMRGWVETEAALGMTRSGPCPPE